MFSISVSYQHVMVMGVITRKNYEAYAYCYITPTLRHQSTINSNYFWNNWITFCHLHFSSSLFSVLAESASKKVSVLTLSRMQARQKCSSTSQMFTKNSLKRIFFQSKMLSFCAAST